MEDRVRAVKPEYLNVVDESKDWLVVDKPAYLVCHPSAAGPASSLIGRLRLYFADRPEVSPHFVNRLDRETSGLVLVSKLAHGHGAMCRAYEQAEKVYWAVVAGWPEAAQGSIEAPLGRAERSLVRLKQWVLPGGAAARTDWRLLRQWKRDGRRYSLLEVRPLTGRTHQIRAHLSWMGTPVVGDKIYGPDESLFVEHLEHGWTPRLELALESRRHLLSALELRLGEHHWSIAPPLDIRQFVEG